MFVCVSVRECVCVSVRSACVCVCASEVTSSDLIKKSCQRSITDRSSNDTHTHTLHIYPTLKSLIQLPILLSTVRLYITDLRSHVDVRVAWSRQERVKSLISAPQKKFLLEASLRWLPAFLPNALFLLIGALEYQGQLFPCH